MNDISSVNEITRIAEEAGDEYSSEYSQESARAILRERARILAMHTDDTDAHSESTEVVEFILAGENYAFASTAIREVYPVKEITPLPCTPPFVAGIINLRGQILSVLDLKQLFGLPHAQVPHTQESAANRVLIISSQEMDIGVTVDEVLGMRQIAVDDIQALPPTLGGIRTEYIEGITSERLIVLDARRLLDDEKIIVNEEVA